MQHLLITNKNTMKKLIYTILASSFILSCSTNSSNDNANNPLSTGMLVKTWTSSSGSVTTSTTLNYNVNKLVNSFNSDGTTYTFTYNGDLIIKNENVNGFDISNYSNNLLVSSASNWNSNNTSSTYNSTYTYNSDGSITEIRTGTSTYSGNTTSSSNKYIRFYSQGNCVKKDEYSSINGVMTLTGSILFTFDDKNSPFKNITGFYTWQNSQGYSVNNAISETFKNASGVITNTFQRTYQYNSQNYPISLIGTSTSYTINPQTGTSTPGTPNVVSNLTYTYY